MTSLPVSSAALGWHRRPEYWSAVLALIGVAIAGYLTIVHFRESLLVCSGISDCETVQTSQYAEILGIPVGTAHSRLHYAMRSMRAALEADARPIRREATR